MEKTRVIKTVVLCVTFVITFASTFLSLYARQDEIMYTTFESTSIPVLYMKTEGGELFNPSKGYITDLDGRTVFNGITPINEDRKLNVSLYSYGSRISSISYQIRDIDTGILIEDTTVNDYVNQEDYVNATFNIKNLIEKDKEYLFTVTISTDKYETIRYYGRIVWSDGINLDEKLEFVMGFNKYSYNKDSLSTISQWMETSDDGDNTNLGRVSIKSTRAQVGWGSLIPRIEGNITPIIWQIDSKEAQISLNYRVVTTESNLEYEAYTVKDYYRIIQTADTIYLMDYEREADQIFDGYNDLQTSGRIDLGIKSDLGSIESKADSTGRFSYFEQNGALWGYARNDNRFTKVFDFVASSDYSGRELDMDHDIRIITVDIDGNVWFSVSGYMNGGGHDGQMGVSLFYYNYTDNIVEEKVFIPVNASYTSMKNSTGDVSYVSGDIYYVKINQYLYSIDLISGEYMLISDSLFDETYAVNGSGTRIAYHENHTVNSSKVIKIYDFTEGKELTINGSEYGGGKDTDYLKLIGYIEDDLIYGLAAREDVEALEGINALFPMYGIVIVGGDDFTKKKYEQPGYYVYLAEIAGMRVNLWRVTKTEDGGYESATIDQIMNSSETGTSSIYTEVVTSSLRQKELYLNIPSSSGDTKNVDLRVSKEVIFSDQGIYEMDSDYVFNQKYMAYGRGEWIGKFSQIQKAVSNTAGYYGFVLNLNGDYVWRKEMGNIKPLFVPGETMLSTSSYKYDLKGMSMDNVLYYVSMGHVVAGLLGENKYIYIYDYDTSNIKYYDYELNQEVTLDKETASKLFIKYDNTFLVLEK